MTEGDTPEEALEMMQDALRLWLETALEDGWPIPEPKGAKQYSGRLFIRTSPRLHCPVAEAAACQGVSMSQWVSEALALQVGTQGSRRRDEAPTAAQLKKLRGTEEGRTGPTP